MTFAKHERPAATQPIAGKPLEDETSLVDRGVLRRVLVADDDDDFRAALVACLEQAGGLSIVEARDGLEALSLALSTHPEVVLLDYRMPGLNGGEVARRLRDRPAGSPEPQPTIVFITAASEPEKLAADAGVRYFLAKPFSAADVVALLRRAVAER